MNWSYVAGFFDGEGCIRFEVGAISPRIRIVQQGKRGKLALQKIQTFLIDEGIQCRVEPNGGGKRETLWCLYFDGREKVTLFGKKALHFLLVKKSEVQDMLRFLKLYPPLNQGKVWSMLCKEAHHVA